MAGPEIRFIGPEYDGAEDEVSIFADKLAFIVKHAAADKHGKEHALSPTDIEIAPTVFEGDHFFVIRAWHETAAARGRVGVLQPFVGSFDLVLDDKDGYLHHREEGGANYVLTTVETITLDGISRLAADREIIFSSPADNL